MIYTSRSYTSKQMEGSVDQALGREAGISILGYKDCPGYEVYCTYGVGGR